MKKILEGEALEKLILKNMRDLLIKSTELTPLVVVIEDLHWADTSSIELLESLFRLAETKRILFINVFRPNHPETGDRVIETIKEKLPVYYVEIHLLPLNEQMSEKLIKNMLHIKGLQHAVVDQIIQRAGGNLQRHQFCRGPDLRETFVMAEKRETVLHGGIRLEMVKTLAIQAKQFRAALEHIHREAAVGRVVEHILPLLRERRPGHRKVPVIIPDI